MALVSHSFRIDIWLQYIYIYTLSCPGKAVHQATRNRILRSAWWGLWDDDSGEPEGTVLCQRRFPYCISIIYIYRVCMIYWLVLYYNAHVHDIGLSLVKSHCGICGHDWIFVHCAFAADGEIYINGWNHTTQPKLIVERATNKNRKPLWFCLLWWTALLICGFFVFLPTVDFTSRQDAKVRRWRCIKVSPAWRSAARGPWRACDLWAKGAPA